MIHLAEHVKQTGDFLLYLRGGAEDVGIVLREASHSGESGGDARFLITVQASEICEP